MTRGDQLLERAADRLDELSRRYGTGNGGGNGLKAKLAAELRDDAEFVRKLKPSLIAARARGHAPAAAPPERPEAPVLPEPSAAPEPGRPKRKGSGPNPFLVVAGALVVGVALAKWIDWRGHAHPRG